MMLNNNYRKDDIINYLTPNNNFKIVLKYEHNVKKFIAKILVSKNDKVVIFGKNQNDIVNKLTEIIDGLKHVVEFLRSNKGLI